MKPYNILQKLDIMVKVLPKPNKKKRPTKKLIPFSLYSSSTLTYRKLPEQQSLKLSVLKLDGSSFRFWFRRNAGFASVHVARNATVAALKFAVQEEFCLSPRDERTRLCFMHCRSAGKKFLSMKNTTFQEMGVTDARQKFKPSLHVLVSRFSCSLSRICSGNIQIDGWNSLPDRALVWSHFCLCYQGQKLIRDVDCIQKYGIKDGDQSIWILFLQLCFVQHLRVDLAPALEQSNNPSIKSKQASNGGEDELRCSGELALLRQPKSRLTGSLKELLSCSKF